MTFPILADVAALVASVFAWRVSRSIAVALALAVAASLVHAATDAEWLRWSSALVGLVGAIEIWRRARVRENEGWYDERRAHAVLRSGRARSFAHALRIVERAWHDQWDVGRPDVLAVLCVMSMAGDGAAYLVWQHLAEWVQPAVQLLMSGLAIAVSVWPRRRSS